MPNFFENPHCQAISNRNLFGLCDADDTNPAYLDDQHGSDWIAVVENGYAETVCFTAIDNCIELLRPDGNMDSRCDGMLSYKTTLIFVELKDRNILGSDWVKKGDNQLRSTITAFENTDEAEKFTKKKAYIANKAKPKFRDSQIVRMEKFRTETGYDLRIENRIKID